MTFILFLHSLVFFYISSFSHFPFLSFLYSFIFTSLNISIRKTAVQHEFHEFGLHSYRLCGLNFSSYQPSLVTCWRQHMSGFHLSLPSLLPPSPLISPVLPFPLGFWFSTTTYWRLCYSSGSGQHSRRLKFSFNLLILHLGEFSETGRIFEMVTGWMKDKDVWKNG